MPAQESASFFSSILVWVVAGFIILAPLWLAFSYNRLVSLRNRVKEAWSDIEVQLKRRHDLIPNLVETVKGYATHEREVFEKVTEARTAALGAHTPKELGQAENMLTGTLKTLFAVAEAYPDLKASTNFVELQRELTDTEDKVQAARRFYNGNARDFNTAIESFPTNLVAKLGKFKAVEFFEIGEPGEREPVKVDFANR